MEADKSVREALEGGKPFHAGPSQRTSISCAFKAPDCEPIFTVWKHATCFTSSKEYSVAAETIVDDGRTRQLVSWLLKACHRANFDSVY